MELAEGLWHPDPHTVGGSDAARLHVTAAAPEAAALGALRVLIVHDWLVAWAGSERVVEELLAIFPQADLVVGVLRREMRDLNAVTRRARETWLGRLPGARRHHRWYLPLFPAAFASIDTTGYDLVISSSHAFSKCVRTSAPTRHLCFCYSPPRYLWDLQEEYTKHAGPATLALQVFTPVLRWIDRRAAARVDTFVADSSYIANRILRSYQRTSTVVYPPAQLKPVSSTTAPRGNDLLAFGRLVPYKRVDLAIAAAGAIGARLIVAGDGPERASLQRLAGSSVEFVGEVSEARAGELMETSGLLLFCAEEDFGITPIEANAHGLPVVAFGRGGALETMEDGVSGVFFEENTVESLVGAIERARSMPWDDTAVRANANRFTSEQFRAGFVRVVQDLFRFGPSA